MRTMLRVMALAALVLVPAAQGESVPTTLYLHVINIQDMPINTQPPAEGYASDVSYGPGLSTLTCLDPLTGDVAGTGLGSGGTTSQRFHTSYGYATANLVEYDDRNANGDPRTHPTRGFLANVSVDPGAPMALHWFLLASTGGSESTPDLGVPAVPDIVVHATLRAGAAISINDDAYNQGRILFEGKAGPATLANGEVIPGDGMAGEVRVAAQVGDAWLYEFIVPLAGLDPVIVAGEGFNVRVDTRMESDSCSDPDHTVAPGTVYAASRQGHRPRIEWSVEDPMATGRAVLSEVNGTVHAVADIGTVFGPYDVRDVALSLTRTHRGEVTAIDVERVERLDYGPCGHDCGHIIVVTYEAPELVDAKPGVYELRVAYSNLQGTAHRELVSSLTVEPARESPAPAPAVLLVGLLLIAMLARRR